MNLIDPINSLIRELHRFPKTEASGSSTPPRGINLKYFVIPFNFVLLFMGVIMTDYILLGPETLQTFC